MVNKSKLVPLKTAPRGRGPTFVPSRINFAANSQRRTDPGGLMTDLGIEISTPNVFIIDKYWSLAFLEKITTSSPRTR
jgi:hypothetical protein